jgi:phosphoribosylaminoimidazole-succinocarboxamide synthase
MSTSAPCLPFQPGLPLPFLGCEGDRDLYDLGERRLVVASDRISAAGQPLPDRIPDKGRILTRLARYGFQATQDLLPNLLAASDPGYLPEPLRPFREALDGRFLLVRKADPVPVRCAVHGCLTGAVYDAYLAHGSISGVMLPPNCKKNARLPKPLVIPYLEEGPDQRRHLSMAEAADLLGLPLVRRLKDLSLAIFLRGYHLAGERGLVLGDLQCGFARTADGGLALADPVLTPDSCRFWTLETWRPGADQPTMDRRFLEEYLDGPARWDGRAPAPRLPGPVIGAIRASYLNLAQRFGLAP